MTVAARWLLGASRRVGAVFAAARAGVAGAGLFGAACHPTSAGPAPNEPPHNAAAVSAGVEPGRGASALEREGGPSIRTLEPCLPQGYEVCFNALDDNCNGALEEGCGIPAGVVQFMIGWDALKADVDLNVTDPKGQLIEAGRVVQSGLIKSRDCPGRRQECGGVNLENVFLEGNKAPTRGTYRVSVALESLGGEQPPIWVNLSSRLGAKRYAFEVRLMSPEDERHVELSL
jgi:tRNA (guanosine-2'-O-)-methyltransferase